MTTGAAWLLLFLLGVALFFAMMYASSEHASKYGKTALLPPSVAFFGLVSLFIMAVSFAGLVVQALT